MCDLRVWNGHITVFLQITPALFRKIKIVFLMRANEVKLKP